MALATFLAAANQAVRAEDGRTLGAMLRLDKKSVPGGGQLVAALLGTYSIANCVADVFSPASADDSRKLWHGVFTEHLSAVAALARGGSEDDAAYAHAHAALAPMQLLMREADTNWLMSPLHALIADARALSVAMERRLVARGHRHDALARISELTTTLRDAFSYTINHKIPRDRIMLVRVHSRGWCEASWAQACPLPPRPPAVEEVGVALRRQRPLPPLL